jgi:hypothetical protein
MMSEENRRLLMSGQGDAALQAWKASYYTKAGVAGDKCVSSGWFASLFFSFFSFFL